MLRAGDCINCEVSWQATGRSMSAGTGDLLLRLRVMTLFWSIIKIITEVFSMQMFNPPHPGTVLKDYLNGVSVTDAANHLGVTRVALSRILNGSAAISADMALRLADALGTSPDLWIGMQSQYDLWKASKKRRPKVSRLVSV